MQLPYQIVTQQNPFLYFTVQNFNLQTLSGNTGVTNLTVWRKRKRGGSQVNFPGGSLYPPVYYTALEITPQQRFTFVLDSQIFQQPEGRFIGWLQYNGTSIGTTEFIYSNPNTLLVPDNPLCV